MYLLVNRVSSPCVICFAGLRDTARHLTNQTEAFEIGTDISQKTVKED